MYQLLRRTYRLLPPPFRRRMVLSVIGSVGVAGVELAALALVLPFVQVLNDPSSLEEQALLRQLADLVGATGQDSFLTRVGVVIVVLFGLRAAVSLAFHWWQQGFLARAEAVMGTELLEGYLRAPYVMHLRRNSAELIRNVQTSTLTFFNKVVFSILQLISEAVFVLAVVVALFLLEPLIATAATFFFAVVAGGYAILISRRSAAVGAESQELAGRTQQLLQESLDGAKEIRVRRREGYFTSVFASARLRSSQARRVQAFLQQVPRYYLDTTLFASVIGLTLYVTQARSAEDAVPVLGLFAIAGFRVMPSISRILVYLNSMTVGSNATAAVAADIADARRWIAAAGAPVERPLTFERDLAVEGLRFRYPGADADVLHGLDFRVRRGEWIGLVGSSGAGKSTLVDLILGLLEPTGGVIKVDGRPITEDLGGWQQQIGYVPQSIHLLDDTLRRNVAFGEAAPAIDDDAVWRALQMAQLDEFVERLPRGLDTLVGERGARFSGGERQRIGLARALYHAPELVILDEATSALDAETESRVSQTIERLRGHKTLIVIAHRLTTVRLCDRLLLLQGGVVAAEGPFDELQATSSVFAELVRLGRLQPVEAHER